jgi:hypothetical protein
MASETGAQRVLAHTAAAMALLVCFAVVLDFGRPSGTGAPPASVVATSWQSESFVLANAPAPPAGSDQTMASSGRRSDPDTPADVAPTPAPVREIQPASATVLEPTADDGGLVPNLPPAIPVAAAPVVAAEPPAPDYAGLWMPDPAACSWRDVHNGLLPTIITTEGASAGETFCTFTNQTRTESGWRVSAQCRNGGKRWTTQVRLTLAHNRLVWESKRGRQVYTRCDADLRLAARP